MKRFKGTPVAWLQLTRNKVRLLVAIAGIAFAAILMFMQLAFLDSLYDSQTALHRRLKADLVLVNTSMKTLASTEEFSRQYLYRALNLAEVESVNYVYHGQRAFRYGDEIGGKGIILVGINPEDPAIDFPRSDRLLPLLRTIGVVLFDRNSNRKEYGKVIEDLKAGSPVAAEVAGRKVWIADIVDFAGASFADDGNLITSTATFQRLTGRDADLITIGLIRLQPNASSQKVIEQVQALVPANVKVMTLPGFINYEKNYWSTTAPIGFVFGVGVLVGFLVGVIIVYQVLFNEVVDHLPDYALLKARGYKHRYFLIILFQEALIIAVLGYIPGLALSLGLYEFTKEMTSLPIYMTFPRALLVLGLTVGMCFMSGVITVQKLQDADPAELFS